MSSKIKSAGLYLVVFLIIWGVCRLFGPEFLQGQDRKKFIFKSLEYYKGTSSTAGIMLGLIVVGYGFYKYKWTIWDGGNNQDEGSEKSIYITCLCKLNCINFD